MLLEVLGFLAAMIAVIFVPYVLMQVPKLWSSVGLLRGGNGQYAQGWARRLTGLASVAGLPLYGFAFPYATLPAAAWVFARPMAGWPSRSKAVALAAVVGVGALAISALYQGQELSVNVLYYSATALFVVAAVKLTSGEASAAQLLGFAAIGSSLFFIIFRPASTDTFPHLWKYGLGPYIAIICIWFICSLTQRRSLPVLGLVIVGSASLFLGFRSHGLVCFIAAVALLAKGKNRRGTFPFARVVLAGAALLGLSRILPAAVEAGVFGEDVRLRTVAQIGESGPDLLAGRVEPPLSIAAIAEKWLFGWGNLNGIDYATISRGADIAYSFGLVPKDYMHLWVGVNGQISVHSLLGEGWVEGGIAGAALPLLLLGVFVAAIWRASGNWAPLVILVATQGIWDVLFSTWAYNRPFILAISAVLAAWAVSSNRSECDQTSKLQGPAGPQRTHPSHL